jgi:hypothetical protein
VKGLSNSFAAVLRRGQKETNASQIQTSARELQIWAQYAIGILNSKTAVELENGIIDTVFRASIGVPRLLELLHIEAINMKVEAHNKLLELSSQLTRYINSEISEIEYECSKQAAIESFAMIVEFTSKKEAS